MTADTLTQAICLHLTGDFLLQNRWIADNKVHFGHRAGFIHAGIHTGLMLLILPWPIALLIGIIHYVIDLRFILAWWRKFYRQTTEGEMGVHVAIWGDQVAHILVLFLLVR